MQKAARGASLCLKIGARTTHWRADPIRLGHAVSRRQRGRELNPREGVQRSEGSRRSFRMQPQRSIRETETEARQGVTGHNVRYVLMLSCALVVVLMGIVFVLVHD
jgi:hypothetical protein